MDSVAVLYGDPTTKSSVAACRKLFVFHRTIKTRTVFVAQNERRSHFKATFFYLRLIRLQLICCPFDFAISRRWFEIFAIVMNSSFAGSRTVLREFASLRPSNVQFQQL